MALEDPDYWATEYMRCGKCGRYFCDRCIKKIGELLRKLTCSACGGELIPPDSDEALSFRAMIFATGDEQGILTQLRNRGMNIEIREDSHSLADGSQKIFLRLIAKAGGAPIDRSSMLSAANDVWNFIRYKVERVNEAIPLIMQVFVIFYDEETTIAGRISGISKDKRDFLKQMQIASEEMNRFLAYKQDGVFEVRPGRDSAIGLVLAGVDSTSLYPLLLFIGSNEGLRDDPLLSNELLSTIGAAMSGLNSTLSKMSVQESASVYRYLGWRVLYISRSPQRAVEARREFQRALSLFRFDDPETCRGIAQSYYSSQDYRSGLDWYRRVTGSDADNISVLINKEICAIMCNERQEAQDSLFRAASLYPEHPLVNYNLACFYSEKGEVDKALDYLKNAVEAGYGTMSQLDSDSDLDNIRNTKRFHELRRKLRS